MLRGLVIQILPDGKRRGWSGRDLEWVKEGVKETEGEVKEEGKRRGKRDCKVRGKFLYNAISKPQRKWHWRGWTARVRPFASRNNYLVQIKVSIS